MKRTILSAIATLALSGCGLGGSAEDFAVTIKRPVTSVFEPFGDVQLPAEMRALLPTAKMTRTRPSDSEVLYTFPIEGDDPAQVRLVFEAIDGDKATVVHVTVDVPAIPAVIAGKPKVISETLVELALRKLIRDAARQIESGSAASGASNEFSALLAALAIATDKQAMARVQELLKDPAKAEIAMAALGAGSYYDAERDADTPDRAQGDRAVAESDPNAALQHEQDVRDRAEEDAERELRANSLAEDSGSGEAPEPAQD
jgi:hypothetical protein